MNPKKFVGGAAMIATGILLAITLHCQYQNAERLARRWWSGRKPTD